MRATLGLVLAVGLAVSCGSDDDSKKSATGGSGGSSTGATGGSPSGGSGGTAGTSSGGSAGTGGGVDSGSCDAPADPNKAAVCLTIAPDEITFVSGDPAFDGNGIFFLEVFDTPNPPDGTPGLASTAAPAQPNDGGLAQGLLADLVASPFRFEDLPATIYVRAVFADDLAVFAAPNGTPIAGTWIGGVDLANGFGENLPLLPVSLSIGAGTSATVALSPFRKLTLQVSRSVAPVGDAQGSLAMIAVPNAELTATSKIFGIGGLPCADLSGTGSVTVSGVLYGAGPFWVTAILDDFGSGGGLPAGGLGSLEISGGKLLVPSANQLPFSAKDYVVQHSIALGLQIPGSDGGPDPITCGSASDAGSDSGNDAGSDASTD